jgi:hypothetical protein
MDPAKPLAEPPVPANKEIARERQSGKNACFETVLVMMAGCGILLGDIFGMPGVFVGSVLGALLGFHLSKRSNAY